MSWSENLLVGNPPMYTTLLEPPWRRDTLWSHGGLDRGASHLDCGGLGGADGGATDLDDGVGGVADADGAAAHRGRDIAAVEVSHGASFFFCLELQVGLWEEKQGDCKVCPGGTSKPTSPTTRSVGRGQCWGHSTSARMSRTRCLTTFPKGLANPSSSLRKL